MTDGGLTSLISAAVAPVALITSVCIFWSGVNGKYASLAGQMRELTGEYRGGATADVRRTAIRQQLRFFHRRLSAARAASACLMFALIAFFGTVLAVALTRRQAHLDAFGAATLMTGLAFMVAAAGLELYEITLARRTVDGELTDIFEEAADAPARRPARGR